MDLNGPGVSLFQGNDLNNYDNLEEREEEQEALEEQKRRDLELKNMLENAFDDVSFDNDDGSLCNGSEIQSNSGHSFSNNCHPDIDLNSIKETAQNRVLTDFDNNSSNNHIEHFNTPLKHTKKSNQVKRVDFSNDHENYSDQCRKQIQNGSLHDIVDASGGGDGDLQVSSHYKHCFQKSPLGDGLCNGVSNNSNKSILKPNYTEEAEDSSEQLKILYDVRVREVHRLTELIDLMRNEHEIEMKDLKHQLALMMAEKERVNISHCQLQTLLVECKQQVEQLANDVSALEKANKELEDSKRELLMELETAKLTIDDLQRKVIAFEKGGRDKSEAVQYEINIKSLTEKHSTELLNMKKELDNYMRNYEATVKENEELKLKISRLTQINEENLAKKSEIINRLSQQIDDTQKQCESLMRSSTVEDNFRLQTELKIIKEEKTMLSSKIENLEKENSRQEEELKQYESLSRMSVFSGSLSDSKEFEGSDVNGKLGAELYRALSGQKTKRLEIKNLQAQLNEKNELISVMAENEKVLNQEVAKLKEEANKYLSAAKSSEELLVLKSENQKLRQEIEEVETKHKILEESLTSRCQQLEEENKRLRENIASLEKEKTETMNNYSEEYMRFHNEGLERVREETEKFFNLELLKKDLDNENLKKELEDIKNLYVEVYNAKESLLSQVEKEKNHSGRSSGVDLEEVKRLQKELEKSRHRILELDQTLKQQYQQEVEILNLDINQLNLQVEKIKKEKDREVAEKDKILVENELLKSEIEHVTSEKNLLYLDYEKIQKEVEDLQKDIQELRDTSEYQLKELIEKHSLELQNLSNKYEITIKTLKKEIDLTTSRSVKYESKYTSPMKNSPYGGTRNAATQNSLVSVDKSTSPLGNSGQNESTSPTCSGVRRSLKSPSKQSRKDTSVLTDPEPVTIPKKEVVAIMEKLGAHHEEEMKALESKYRLELIKLDKKFQVEVDKAKEIIRRELKKEYMLELEQMEEKHKIELENRIEQEKKEAVVDLITEWACEVQSLKTSYAESQTEMEKMKMKYKAAKSVALQYKTYFKSKAEHMKEEWKRIEDGYEKALKELEKNVHILVDVKEDEVKAKVESITKIYEQKINKMKEKLSKYEEKLKGGTESDEKKKEGMKSQEKLQLEKLSVPVGNLSHKPGTSKKKKSSDLISQLERLRDTEIQIVSDLNESAEGPTTSRGQRRNQSLETITSKDSSFDRDKTTR